MWLDVIKYVSLRFLEKGLDKIEIIEMWIFSCTTENAPSYTAC